jgi:hypothetical protein
MGLDSTLESAVNMAMIKKALAGDVKAYEAIAKYAGQSDRTDMDQDEQQARIERERTQTDMIRKKSDNGEEDEIADDGFLDALKGCAAEDWKDDEETSEDTI